MQLEDYFEFNAEPVEHIRNKGSRIDIDFVIELHKMRMTPEQIAVNFGCPLDPIQVYAAITYYLQNKVEVEAYLERREKLGAANYQNWLAQEPSDAVKRIRAIKAAREAAGQVEAS